MEHLCAVGRQSELVVFLKRAIITTTVSGTILTVPIIICFCVTLLHENHDDIASGMGMILWAFLRISLFLFNNFLRFDVWQKLNECRNEHWKLLPIVHSTSWKLTQTGSFMVSLWLIITIVYSLLCNAHTNHYPLSLSPKPCFAGNVSMCLLRWSLCTVLIFGAHILFIICWLRKVLFKIKKTRHFRHYQVLNQKASVTNEALICSICKAAEHPPLSVYVRLNECPHHFHQICIDKWFDKKKQCPLCLKLYEPSLVAGEEINIRVSWDGHHHHTDSLRLRPYHCSRRNSQMLHFFMPN